MKTENNSINHVLAVNNTSFFIPPFQRSYAWGKPEIERYFDDISRIIKSELNPKSLEKLEHFFGTIVIKKESNGFADKSIVVDGQQRLTTTLLFLIALRDSGIDAKHQEIINQTYLTNSSSDFEDKIKLKQVTKDWDSYRALIKKTRPNSGTISSAYNLLKKQITQYKKFNSQVNFKHYIEAAQKNECCTNILR